MSEKTQRKIADWFTPEILKCNGLLKPNYYKVNYRNIRFFTTKGVKKGYIRLITLDNEGYFDRGTLKEVLRECSYFVMIHKQFVVNINHIDSRLDWSYCWSGEHKLNVSPQYRENFKEKIQLLLQTKESGQ